MRKRAAITSLLAAGLLTTAVSGVTSADPAGDCPVDTGAYWTLTTAQPEPGVRNVGAPVDRNGDGYLCARVNPALKFVWRDNSNPIAEA